MLAFQSVLFWQPASTIVIATTKKQQLSNKQIKDYVVILSIILLQYLCCKYTLNLKLSININHLASKISSSKAKMGDRLNIGREIRELKLGSTFNPQNSQTAFHTIKYDFKPASVDLNRVATVDVGSNNQVTVTVPNLESSGVPHTVFKGNQRKYAKECLLIFDKKTGVMTLEKLNHNIQVKKTRSETTNKAVIPPQQKVENNTQRTSSKTRVSTGSRKNTIIGFVPRNSPMQQGSPSSYNSTHKSPQAAPAKCNSRWNANNAQATLPSIPLIEVDDDIGSKMPSGSTSIPNNSGVMINANTAAMNNADFLHHHQQQQQQIHHNQNNVQHLNSSNGPNLAQTSSAGANLANAAAALEQEIGVLSSSDSSSDSDSSESWASSDSDDSEEDVASKQNQQSQQPPQQPQQPQQPYANGSFPALLHDDLQLSESCSSDSDDD